MSPMPDPMSSPPSVAPRRPVPGRAITESATHAASTLGTMDSAVMPGRNEP